MLPDINIQLCIMLFLSQTTFENHDKLSGKWSYFPPFMIISKDIGGESFAQVSRIPSTMWFFAITKLRDASKLRYS